MEEDIWEKGKKRIEKQYWFYQENLKKDKEKRRDNWSRSKKLEWKGERRDKRKRWGSRKQSIGFIMEKEREKERFA